MAERPGKPHNIIEFAQDLVTRGRSRQARIAREAALQSPLTGTTGIGSLSLGMSEDAHGIEAASTPKDLITQSLESGRAMEDDGRATWNQLVDQILSKQGRIIALRGAGSINGADPEESRRLLVKELIPRIEQARKAGEQVTVLFDGDPDSPQKPDIGYFAGRLLDQFGNNRNGVVFVTAQKRSWYYPSEPGRNLGNANGRDYVTYVFDDGKYPGDHNTFTQDERLVASDRYEQWYIGASGDIATGQLADFNAKVPQGQAREAVLFRVHNNPSLDTEIQGKLAAAQGDEAKVAKFQGQLDQRRNIYGAHWNNAGQPTLSAAQFPNLRMSFVA